MLTRRLGAIVGLGLVLSGALATSGARAADWSGDGKADILTRKPDGALVMYRGNGLGWWVTGGGEPVGSQFSTFDAIVETRDWSGDGKRDLLARKPGGTLFLYRGNGASGWVGGVNEGSQIGSQFDMYDMLITPGDWNGDGKDDLLARKPDGTLFLYRGNGAGGWITGLGEQIGSQFNMFDIIVAVGDWSGDAKPDLLARKPDGALFLYRGDGLGAWLAGVCEGTQIGSQFNMFDALVGPGDWTGDGKSDLLARRNDGTLFLYRGNGAGGWVTGNGEQIGTNFNAFDAMVTTGTETYYPTSWTYGGFNHSVDTDEEIIALYAAMRAGTAQADALYAGLSPRDQAIVSGRFPTSWNYGGGNRNVDTQSEAEAVISAIVGSGGGASGAALRDGLSPNDRGYVAQFLAGRTVDLVEQDVPGTLEPSQAPTSAELTAVGSSPGDEAAASAAGAPPVRCRYTQSKQLKLVVDDLPDMGWVTMRTRFCYNPRNHRAWSEGPIATDYDLANGYEYLGWGLQWGDSFIAVHDWDGYSQGQVNLRRDFDIVFCAAWGLVGCGTEERGKVVTFGRYNGTAVAGVYHR
jgi:hypothetical protein